MLLSLSLQSEETTLMALISLSGISCLSNLSGNNAPNSTHHIITRRATTTIRLKTGAETTHFIRLSFVNSLRLTDAHNMKSVTVHTTG